MIEFKVASLIDNVEGGDFWQGLNAASVALQQAAQSEAAVYQVFSEQLVKLGLQGSINLLDESGKKLRVTSMVFSKRMMRVVKRAEKILNVSGLGFTYAVDASPADEAVLTKGDVVFLPDNSERIRLVLSPKIVRAVSPLIKHFMNQPAILAPIFAQSKVVGVLYVAGASLGMEAAAAIAAFANHLSIALENAQLFQAVQRAELQYRRLFETANDGIFLFDHQSQQLIEANPKMLSLMGITNEDVGSIRPSSWATPDIYKLYVKHLKLALEKGNHFFEVPFVNPHGDVHHWQISANVIRLEGSPVVYGLVRDVTEARRAEEELRHLSSELMQQTRLLEAILAATPDNFLLIDLDGRFLFISSELLDFFNFSVDFVVVKKIAHRLEHHT